MAPSPDEELSGCHWMVETIHHKLRFRWRNLPCTWPARGTPSSCTTSKQWRQTQLSSAEPSKTISSIQSGIFQSLLWPEQVTISTPKRLASQLPGGRAQQRAAHLTPIQPAIYDSSTPPFPEALLPPSPTTTQHTMGFIVGLHCHRY